MANGDLVLLDKDRLEVKLLDGQSAADDGVWVEVGPWRYKTIQVRLLESGGKIELRVSNRLSGKPANTDHEILMATITDDGGQVNADPWKYIKSRKSVAGGSPTATIVDLHANRDV